MADSDLVYSTGDAHSKPTQTSDAQPVHPDQVLLTMRREKQGRRGKEVTAIDGLPANDAYGRELTKALKAACGAGGTWKAGRIEIQGDQRTKVQQTLEAKGFRVKRTGG